jgi:hypothetical protein
MKIAATVLALAIALPTIGSAGEGRYVTTAPNAERNAVFITDSKTGTIRYCLYFQQKVTCTAWIGDDK